MLCWKAGQRPCAKDASRYVTSFDPSVVKFDLASPLQEHGSSVLDPAGLQWWLDTWDGDIAYESGLS